MQGGYGNEDTPAPLISDEVRAPNFPDPREALAALNARRRKPALLSLEDGVINAMAGMFSSIEELMLRHLEEMVALLRQQVPSGDHRFDVHSRLLFARLAMCHRMTIAAMFHAFMDFFREVVGGREASLAPMDRFGEPMYVVSTMDVSHLWLRQAAEMRNALYTHAREFEVLAVTHSWTLEKCEIYTKVSLEMFFYHDEAVATMHTPPGEPVSFWRAVPPRTSPVGYTVSTRHAHARSFSM